MENGYELMKLQFENICKSIWNIFLGPKLPFALSYSQMIASPTERGVVLIGGEYHVYKKEKVFEYDSYDLLELSGDSIDTMEWKILKQQLQYPRPFHISYSISNEIAATFPTKMWGFPPLLCRCYLPPFKL